MLILGFFKKIGSGNKCLPKIGARPTPGSRDGIILFHNFLAILLFEMLKTHWRFFVICLILIAVMIFRFHSGQIQQDNYLGYAISLAKGLKNISFFDSRLFPGLPAIICLINFILGNILLSGYLAVFSALIGSYIILYKLTDSTNSFIPLIFPPVMLNQASLIATEIPAIFFILLSIFLFKKQKFALAVLVSACGFWIRPITVIPAVAILIYLFIKNKIKVIKFLPFFLLPVVLLLLFNFHFFGSNNLFHQFTAYRNLGVGTLGITQIFADIPRALRWGWYRIFASGVFYFSLAIFLLISTLMEIKKKTKVFDKTLTMALLASLLFIFSLNSVPFLENLGRYLAPTIPLFWIVMQDKFKSEKWAYFLLPISLIVVLF